jgi:hypothetical protein
MAPETLIPPAGEAQRAGSNGRPPAARDRAVNGPALSVALAGQGRDPDELSGAPDDRQPDGAFAVWFPCSRVSCVRNPEVDEGRQFRRGSGCPGRRPVMNAADQARVATQAWPSGAGHRSGSQYPAMFVAAV